ncbi:MAG TPA: dihydrolipoamide acetyltransferase family protein [Thermoflexales bacterium]|jgi:2-oxoglutarate dehydrogenase E2 component (dihydrolipoamide succinyltransferase)|nr:dihydrolipoamide acetyltransferase family protein [Thermoflexales bacterium]HQX09703.1 dihydrolipoamide acetyltransferase family protein [Thermoflexales bacterium]HQY24038.1 dihydrolipoamide acetyltransferase family protein [Thermoflexales bacterium]HQZ53072.1 dihydrolipoamide acetyltransferase family protein [Thermoflexales bacterium]HRA52540.1 dihydrolipoamide acetyltransferase family protein [Thermoflexales bacterium]
MTTTVRMPKLGESVVEGKIGRWLKQVGDAVREFEPLLEVETDKVTTEVTATVAGTLLQVLHADGAVVAVDTPIAVIGPAGAEIAQAPAPAETHSRTVETVQSRSPLAARATGQSWVSPVVGRMAAEHGIDVATVVGTGEGGRVTKKDVLAFIETRGVAPAPVELAAWEQPGTGELFRPSEEQPGTPVTAAPDVSQTAGETIPLSAMRRAIAEHMLRSVSTSPHVTTVFDVDLSRVAAHRQANKAVFERDGANLTYTPYFVAAIVAGLKKHPSVNASWADNAVRLHKAVNVGVAVALGEDGLIVPVIRNADALNLLGLARAINDLGERARRRQLKPDETQGGTFTLTNHGASGSLFATPIINQPQCAILAAGKIEKRVVVVTRDGVDSIAIKTMCFIGLTFDHRMLDGAGADAFMSTVKAALEGWA